MPKQLTNESKEKLHNALNEKITAADLEIKKLMFNHEFDKKNNNEIIWGEAVKTPYPEILEKKIEGFRKQIENCQLSLRMVHNTGWIVEWRDYLLKVETKKLENEYPAKIKEAEDNLNNADPELAAAAKKRLESLNLEIDNLKDKIKKLNRAKKCNKKDCYGRGYVGFNVMTAEYSFCTCTINTKHFYSVNKSTD